MKKELTALVLLIILFAGTVINIKVIERMSDALAEEVNNAYELMQAENSIDAAAALDSAVEHWLSLDRYTHIFIRHSEISSTTEAFYAFKSDICANDIGAAVGSYALLMEALSSLKTMEQISPGSIF